MNIGVIGAGLTGPGIALTFARFGYNVRLYSRTNDRLEKALSRINADANFLLNHGIIRSRDDLKRILCRVNCTTDFHKISDCSFLIESIPEDFEEKARLFRQLNKMCSQSTIFMTNTSGLSIGKLGKASGRPSKLIGAHFWVPTHLMPLVELVPGERTSKSTISSSFRLLSKIGKKPVTIKCDLPGFIGNRLQYALIREAIALVSKGAATPTEIDSVVKYGFGLRLPVIGPLETVDIAGLDTVKMVGSYLFRDLDRSPTVPKEIIAKVKMNQLGVKNLRGFYKWKPKDVANLISLRDEELARRMSSMSEPREAG